MTYILKTAWLELENFLSKKALWILTSAYAGFTFAVCLLPDLRQSYFANIESVPVMLLNFIAPVFLVVILTGMLSPVFAGDRENNVNLIPSACLIGKTGRSIAKMLAAILLSVLICLIITAITFIETFLCGLFDGDLKIKYVGTELKLNPVWSAWQHFGFSFICLLAACIILTLFVLFFSCCTRTTISASALSSIFMLFEILFNSFSFPAILQEYNIWVLFKPYYLFVMRIFNISPFINLLLLAASFLPLCIFAAWKIIKQ